MEINEQEAKYFISKIQGNIDVLTILDSPSSKISIEWLQMVLDDANELFKFNNPVQEVPFIQNQFKTT